MIRSIKYLTIAFICVFLSISSAWGIKAGLYPYEMSPGDPFVVKVSGFEAGQKIVLTIEGKEIPVNKCGKACITGIGAVDIETRPGENEVIIHTGNKQVYIPISIKKPDFPEFHLTLPENKVVPNPDDLARAKREDEKLKQIWQKTTETLYHGNFIVPLQNAVSTGFGVRRIMNNEYVSVHRGIDIKGARGEEIRASNRGRIVLAEELFFGGNTIIIDHGQGIYSIYMHIDRFAAKPGDLVEKGDVIAFVGSTGRATGPHLHFGIKILSENANPLSFIRLNIQ